VGNIASFFAINTTSTSVVATITVTATAAGCVGPSTSFTIQVDPTPHVTNAILTDLFPCTGGNATFVATADVIGATFTFTASASSGSITGWTASGFGTVSDNIANSSSTGGTVTYVFTPHGNAPTDCVGPTASYVVTLSTCVGIEEYTNDDNITIYPNPATSTFTIESKYQVQSIQIYNLLGEEILNTTPNNNQYTININQFSKGIYFVEIKTENGVVRKKVVKE
jgi:hypothetical protein